MILQGLNLHKYYNSKHSKLHVLKGVDIEVDKSEFVCILGASGAGKSTLLHFLAGLDKPSEGQVLLNGQNIYKIRDKQRALIRNKYIGVVFQFYHLLPEFSAQDNIMLPALIAGKSRKQAREKADSLLEEVGLFGRKSHKPSELSGGEQQRIAIARALVNDPQILICDEPTGNLDSQTGKKVFQLLIDLNRKLDITLIVATHSQEIAKIAKRTLTIKDGKI
jgi:lipoprotein-releasing system ATP-binding protein